MKYLCDIFYRMFFDIYSFSNYAEYASLNDFNKKII